MSKIKEDAKKKKIMNKTVAEQLNVTTGMVTHYYSYKNMMPFNKFIDLLSIIYEEQSERDTYINRYLDELLNKNKAENAREAVEWYFHNGCIEKVKRIIDKYKKEDVYFKVYNLLYKRNMKIIDTNNFLLMLNEYRENGIVGEETKAICRIANIYAMLDLRGYSIVNYLTGEAEHFVNLISNDFIKKSFLIRITEMKARSYLMNNNIEEAELLAKKLIEETNETKFPIPVCLMYHLLSEIYTFSDYEKAIEFNKKALIIFSKSNVNNILQKEWLESTHDFIKIYHGIDENLYLNDRAELAHYYAKFGGSENVSKAIDILNELERTNNGLSPHQIYYKALILKSNELMFTAEEAFISKGNLFYSQIPRKARCNIK